MMMATPPDPRGSREAEIAAFHGQGQSEEGEREEVRVEHERVVQAAAEALGAEPKKDEPKKEWPFDLGTVAVVLSLALMMIWFLVASFALWPNWWRW
jgi:hypothetical protein